MPERMFMLLNEGLVHYSWRRRKGHTSVLQMLLGGGADPADTQCDRNESLDRESSSGEADSM